MARDRLDRRETTRGQSHRAHGIGGWGGGPRDWWRIVVQWDADFWPDSTTLEGWTVKYQGKVLS
jgi:hypothetical protein